MKTTAAGSTLALVLFGGPSPARAGEVPAPPEFARVREAIEDGIRKGLAPSLAVAVIRGNRVVWAEGFGVADLEEGTRATADSIYLLASVSKPITATGLMVLKDRGLVDLDAPANRYLGEGRLRAHSGSADEMTLRRLANHTAGLPLHYNFFYEGTAPPPRDETIRRYGFAAWAPGSEWAYSNLAFGILDHVVARVSRTPWRVFMEKEVYDPLGMSRTSDHVRPGREADATVQYFTDLPGRFVRVTPYTFDHPGASAVWSSASDLARFVLMHLNDGELDGVRVLSAASAREMRTRTSRRPDGSGTGVGWGVGTYFGRPAFSHGGGMPGVATMVRAFPEDQAATIVLANTSDRTLTNDVTERLTAVLFPKGKPPEEPEEADGAGERAAFVGAWTGRLAHFRGDIPLTLVVAKDGKVTARFAGRGEPVRLQAVSFAGGRLRGEMDGLLETQEGYRGIPRLRFELRRGEGRLAGVCVAFGSATFALSHWVDLGREGGG
jgi:CubicO group peptidase (beta-lactamase class C family)